MQRCDISREYESAITKIVSHLYRCEECSESDYFKRGGERTVLIVIEGDRGLAGGYNANVSRLCDAQKYDKLIPIGKRAVDRYDGENKYSSEFFTLKEANELSLSLCRDFCEKKFDKLGIVYTEYHSMLKQTSSVKWILPYDGNAQNDKVSDDFSSDAIFEPDKNTVLDAAIYEYVTASIVSKVRESFLSETVARRMAMDSAGKNASEMIEDLQLKYNRARQGAITQEITEIVAGSGM